MSYLDEFKLTGKSVIITGGSKGLGRSMALGLADAGARVAVVSRSKTLLEETAQEIIRAGGEAIAIPADVKNDREVQQMVERVTDQYGAIDILVNSAGIAPMNRAVNITLDEWNDVMDTNMKSMFLTARTVGKRMIKQRHGKVINLGSVLGKGALDLCLHYGASKAAVMQMTRVLAYEWAPFGINVNCIAPGFFATEMTRVQQEDERFRTFLIEKIPLKRFGRPQEIVGLAIFLSSSSADYITGETIFIDGGYSIW